MSRLYFHQTVLFAVVFVVVILPTLRKTDFFLSQLAGLIVFLLTFYFFMRFLYFVYKTNAVSFALQNGTNIGNNNDFLMISSHDSNSIIEAYSFDGLRRFSIMTVKGRERKVRLKYYSLGSKGRLCKINEHGVGSTSYLYLDQNDIKFFYNNEKIPIIKNDPTSKRLSFIAGPNHYEIKRTYSNRLLLKNGQAVISIKKGLMPITLQQYFHPNTPLLKIHSSLEHQERCICLFLITLL